VEGRTLKQWFLLFHDNLILLNDAKKELENLSSPHEHIYQKRYIDTLTKKHRYILEGIRAFGKGTLIRVSWSEYDKEEKTRVRKLEQKQLLLVNTDLENSKLYFNFLINDNKDLIIFESINFEEIEVGVPYLITN
jgi:hypothetical protein